MYVLPVLGAPGEDPSLPGAESGGSWSPLALAVSRQSLAPPSVASPSPCVFSACLLKDTCWRMWASLGKPGWSHLEVLIHCISRLCSQTLSDRQFLGCGRIFWRVTVQSTTDHVIWTISDADDNSRLEGQLRSITLFLWWIVLS